VLWVSDFTYVATWAEFVYVAFVIDTFARRIVGRQAKGDWFNHRLLEPIGDIPPAEAEERYYATIDQSAMTAWLKPNSFRRTRRGSVLLHAGPQHRRRETKLAGVEQHLRKGLRVRSM